MKKLLKMLGKKRMRETSHLILERTQNKFEFGVNMFLEFPDIRKKLNTLNSKSIPNQDLFQAPFCFRDGESCISSSFILIP